MSNSIFELEQIQPASEVKAAVELAVFAAANTRWNPHGRAAFFRPENWESEMHNVFYVIGVIVVVLAVLSLVGLA